MTAATPIAAAAELPALFTPDEVAGYRRQWDEQGYFILPGIVDAQRLSGLQARIVEEFETWKATGKLFAGGGTLAGHLNCFPGEESRWVYQELQARGVIDLVKQIFPGARRMPNVGMNLNLPGSIAQHYHADRPFTQEFPIVNIALVKTVIENGAIDVLPGTNKQFYPYWKFALQNLPRLSTRVALEQGDVLVRSSNLWHRGMPNLSKAPRPMMALTWEDGGSVQDDPFQWSEGRIVFRENWFRTNWLGRMRERTFIAAPITYNAVRFVRSLFGNKGYDH